MCHDKPRISVIIGNHSQRYVALAEYSVPSVLSCEYPRDRLEIIIVDNNCDDESFGRIQALFQGDDSVRVVSERRAGTCFMRNRGFAASTGEIIAYIDDDCEVDTNWLSRIASFYRDASIHFGGGAIFDVKLNRFIRSERNLTWRKDLQLAGGNMSFRRSVLNRNQFDTNLKWDNDEFELMFRLHTQGLGYYFDTVPITHHRADSKYRSVTRGVEHMTKTGYYEERFGRIYYKVKREIFVRNYGKSAEPMIYTARELLRCTMLAEMRIWKSVVLDNRSRTLWDLLKNGPGKLWIVSILARIAVYRDLRKLMK